MIEVRGREINKCKYFAHYLIVYRSLGLFGNVSVNSSKKLNQYLIDEISEKIKKDNNLNSSVVILNVIELGCDFNEGKNSENS